MALATAPKPGAYISEVVVQGIRRFGEVRRFTLMPGYNVLYGLSAAGKSTLYEVLLSLLFARPEQGEPEAFKSLLPQGQAACRAGMSLTVDGQIFRILKDYQAKSVTLSKQLPDRKFELVASDRPKIERWLKDVAHVDSGAAFGRLFTLTRSDFPSTTAAVAVLPVRRDQMDTGFDDRLRAMGLGEKRELLTKLLDEYRRHAEMKTSEFLQDGLRTKLFEVEALLRKREEARAKIGEINLELKDIEKVPKLPDGIDDHIEAYKRHLKTKEAELEHLLPRQDEAHQDLQAMIPAPFEEKDFRGMRSPLDMVIAVLKKDRQFQVGLGAVIVGVGVSFFIAAVGALVAIGGLAFAVIYRLFMVVMKKKEQFDAMKKGVDALDEQVRLVERKWDIETTVVRNLMKAYDTDSPTEMKEIESKRDELASKRKRFEDTISGLALANGEKDLDKEHAKISRQIAMIDEKLQSLSDKLSTDPKEIEPQIERLDRDVARAEGRKPTSRAKLFGTEEAGDDEGDMGRNAIVTMVETWCATRKADLGKLLRSIQESFQKNVRAISGGKITEAQFDATGSVSVRDEGRAGTPFEMLDGMGKDAVYLALRLTLFQLESRGQGRPVILLDDPFEFEDGRLALLSRAFKALGSDAQVLHLTSRPIHQRLADHQLEI